jgi:L-threonylcarbamoyladenylate synthase
VTLEQLQRVVPRIVVGRHTSAKPVSPGMKYRHYAPKVPVVLGSPARLALLARKELAAGRNVAVLAAADRYPSGAVVRIIGRSSEKWASRLFAELRSLERSGADIILAEKITASGVGRAVMNRLRKAASEVLA